MNKRNRFGNVMRKMNRQRGLVLAFSILMAFVLGVGSTFAWFTSSDTMLNPFKSPDLPFSFVITEEFTPPGTVDPGDEIIKEVSATNTGELPGFVRLLVLAEIMGADGTVLPGNHGTEFTYVGLNTTDWKYGGDGYYYYLGVLAPGEKAPNLFTGVGIVSGLGDEYKNAGMKIEVKLEATEIAKWEYREGWWNGATPVAPSPLAVVDAALSVLAN